MGCSKTSIISLALSMLQLMNNNSNSNFIVPSSTLPSQQVFYSSKFNNQTPINPQVDDDKYIEQVIRQNRLRELADMNIKTAQKWEKIHSVLLKYTKLPTNTLSFIEQESDEKDVPISIVIGLMQQESSFQADLINPNTGAEGLGQIEQPTAVELASRGGFDEGSLSDPISNARLAISYLSYLYNKTGEWNATLTAYNRGLTGLRTYQSKYGTSISDYSKSVMQNAHYIDGLIDSE